MAGRAEIKVEAGDSYGPLVVIEELPKVLFPCGKTARKFQVLCHCGNIFTALLNGLRTGRTQSCGCLQRELQKKNSTTHGLSDSPLYSVWTSMRTRCRNPAAINYERYGGRGISICDEWETFEGFLKDMYPSYQEGLTLERVDVNGNYCPENCTWIPPQQQPRNTRMHRSNTSGVTGVCLVNNKRSWLAHYTNEAGKLVTKSFSITKYGNEEAFKRACECREIWVKSLVGTDFEYGQFHGL